MFFEGSDVRLYPIKSIEAPWSQCPGSGQETPSQQQALHGLAYIDLGCVPEVPSLGAVQHSWPRWRDSQQSHELHVLWPPGQVEPGGYADLNCSHQYPGVSLGHPFASDCKHIFPFPFPSKHIGGSETGRGILSVCTSAVFLVGPSFPIWKAPQCFLGRAQPCAGLLDLCHDLHFISSFLYVAQMNYLINQRIPEISLWSGIIVYIVFRVICSCAFSNHYCLMK